MLPAPSFPCNDGNLQPDERNAQLRIALLHATRGNDVDAVKALILAGAEVDASEAGMSAIQLAVQLGHADLVTFLGQAGADLDRPIGSSSLLMVAARQGHTAVIDALLSLGANADFADDLGLTATMYAVVNGSAEAVEALIASGNDLDAPNSFGMTALMIAADCGHAEIARMLCLAGADRDSVDDYGYCAMRLAQEKGHLGVIDVLTQAAAGAAPAELATAGNGPKNLPSMQHPAAAAMAAEHHSIPVGEPSSPFKPLDPAGTADGWEMPGPSAPQGIAGSWQLESSQPVPAGIETQPEALQLFACPSEHFGMWPI